MEEISPLHQERLKYQPHLPLFLKNLSRITVEEEKPQDSHLQSLFPEISRHGVLTFLEGESPPSRPFSVGIVFSGGPAPGGHNVIAGLFDALKKLHPASRLWGFIGGALGIMEDEKKELTASLIDVYRNTGGFDLLQTGRAKIEKTEQFEKALQTVQKNSLDALVIIGGDDSNTNAALLAEYFLKNKSKTQVIGIPKTIDGDLRHEKLEISFGYDTATKTYSEIIGNICRDALSAKKYYHFIKLMGRSASHITLECALATHPNIALIGEEIAARNLSLSDVIAEIADVICQRAIIGKQYGVILIPEGLLEFIPEVKVLINEINKLLLANTPQQIYSQLPDDSKALFSYLPQKIQEQLLLDRDPHGNVQLSMISTDELMLELVKKALKGRSDYKGKFTAVSHFLGYEGRCGYPSNFDADYCYAIGHIAALLIDKGYTGYLATIFNLNADSAQWKGGGIPLISMIHLEERKGKQVPVIKKYLVKLDQAPFQLFANLRMQWNIADHYRYPGPIQFQGNSVIINAIPKTLTLKN